MKEIYWLIRMYLIQGNASHKPKQFFFYGRELKVMALFLSIRQRHEKN
jgi:hypothetical protein